MDNRTYLINTINLAMQGTISTEQLEKLNNVLISKLNEYEIEQRHTEIAIVDDSSIEILKQYIVCKQMEGLSEKTLNRYFSIDKEMLLDIGKRIEDITTNDLRLYLINYRTKHTSTTHTEVSNRSLDGMRKIFLAFFCWCVDNKYISCNPMKGIAQIKWDKKVRKAYSEIDVEKVKRDCTTLRDRALLEFLYSTGCRVSEVVSLNISDVNFQNNTVKVFGKGAKERIVFMSDVAMLYLKEYLASRTDDGEWLFATLKAPYGRFHKNGIEAMLRKHGSSAGVQNVHPHRYRRTLATNLVRKGMPIQEVSKLLGHSDVNTTMIYCDINMEDVHNAYNKCF